MSGFDFSEMLDKAKESGALQSEVPKGRYTLKIKNANVGETKAKDPRFGFQWQVVSGEQEGSAFWDNVQFVPPRGDKPGNLGVSFSTFERYGIKRDFFASNPSPEEVKEKILEIGLIEADVEFVTKGGYTNVQLRNIKHLGNVDPSLSAPPAATSKDSGSAPAGRSF
jgi:hypothetical protein